MSCRCNDATELYGPEAETYARDHLHSQETRGDAFEEILACPARVGLGLGAEQLGRVVAAAANAGIVRLSRSRG